MGRLTVDEAFCVIYGVNERYDDTVGASIEGPWVRVD